MTWTLFIYGVVPLLAFVIVDTYAGMKWAVGSADDLASLLTDLYQLTRA